jgi:hypothetical protein
MGCGDGFGIGGVQTRLRAKSQKPIEEKCVEGALAGAVCRLW